MGLDPWAIWILSKPDVWDFLGYSRVVPEKLFGAPTAHSEFFGLIYLVLFLWAWRKVCHRFPVHIYGCIERYLPRTKFIIQWHTIMAVSVTYQLVKVLLKLFIIDWQGWGLIVNDEKMMHVPPFIMTLANYSPFACMASVVMLGIQLSFTTVSKNYLHVVDVKTETLNQTRYKWFWQLDVMMIMQTLPVWFNLTPLVAFLRIWQVIIGTTSHKPGVHLEDYISMFRGCLSMAVLVEYLSIFAFCKLLLSYFDEEANNEDSTENMAVTAKRTEHAKWKAKTDAGEVVYGRTKIYWLLLVGAVLCVSSGMLNAFMEIVRLIAYHTLPHQNNQAELCTADAMKKSGMLSYLMVFCKVSDAKPFVDKVSSAMMIVLTIIMTFACKTPAVSNRLPKANLKFNGAKIIVMLAQVQGKLLVPESFLSTDYAKNTVFGAIPKINFKGVTLPGWNGYITSLLHVSLLQYEILFVAIIQYILWRDEKLTNKLYNEKESMLEKSLLEDNEE